MTRKNSNRSKPSYVRRLGLERAVKSGFFIFVKGKIQPRLALGLPRRSPRKIIRMLAEKACRTRVNREGAHENRKVRKLARKKNKQGREFNALVNTMSNHQRNLWARAGYPGLRHKDIKPMKKFTTLGLHELLARRPTQ